MDKDLFGICPFVTTQRLLQGKWSILVLHHLSEGPVRFNELQRRMPKMTHATLSRQLKQMEADQLIDREDMGTVPPCVQYRLSPIGEQFLLVLSAMQKWGQSYIDNCLNVSPQLENYAKSFDA